MTSSAGQGLGSDSGPHELWQAGPHAPPGCPAVELQGLTAGPGKLPSRAQAEGEVAPRSAGWYANRPIFFKRWDQ